MDNITRKGILITNSNAIVVGNPIAVSTPAINPRKNWVYFVFTRTSCDRTFLKLNSEKRLIRRVKKKTNLRFVPQKT